MALISTFVENFDSALNGSIWTTSTTGNTGESVAASGGFLVCTMPGTVTNQKVECTAVTGYDLTGSSVYFKFVQPMRTSGDLDGSAAYMSLRFSTDGSNEVGFRIQTGGTLYTRFVEAWTTSDAYLTDAMFTTNANTHVWFRIREASGTIYFDTAPASASNPPVSGDWVNQWSHAKGTLTITAGKVVFGASSWDPVGAGAAIQPAKFDGLNTSATIATVVGSMAATEGNDTFVARNSNIMPSCVPSDYVERYWRDYTVLNAISLNAGTNEAGVIADSGEYKMGTMRWRDYSQCGLAGFAYDVYVDPLMPSLLPSEYLMARPLGEIEPIPGVGIRIYSRPTTGPAMDSLISTSFPSKVGMAGNTGAPWTTGMLSTHTKISARPPFARVSYWIPHHDFGDKHWHSGCWSVEDGNRAWPNDRQHLGFEYDDNEYLDWGSDPVHKNLTVSIHAQDVNGVDLLTGSSNPTLHRGDYNPGDTRGHLIGVCTVFGTSDIKTYYNIDGSAWTLTATTTYTDLTNLGAEWDQAYIAFIHGSGNGYPWGTPVIGQATIGPLYLDLVRTGIFAPGTNSNLMLPADPPPSEVTLTWRSNPSNSWPSGTVLADLTFPSGVTSASPIVYGGMLIVVGTELRLAQTINPSTTPSLPFHIQGVKASGAKSIGRKYVATFTASNTIQSIFSGGVDGYWLRSQPVSNFKVGGVALTAYGNGFDTWLDSSGNGRNAVESSGNSSNNAQAAVRDVSYYASNGYSQYATVAGGGSYTGGFYVAFSLDGRAANGGTQYYATLFSDVNTANTGFELKYSGDVGGYIFSAGTGTSRVSVSIQSQALYTYEGRDVVEAWWDGTSLNLRVDFGAVQSVACASVAAGTAGTRLWSSFVGDTYEVVLYKNYCPSAVDRNHICSWLSKQQNMALPPSGDLAVGETGVDTFSGSGTAMHNTMTAVESAVDTFASTGNTGARTGSMSAVEPVADTFSAVSTVNVTVYGFGRASQYGVKDTFSGTTASGPRSGSFIATEGRDTFSAQGAALPNRTGSMIAVETGNDTFSVSSGLSIVTGTMSAVEGGVDSFSASTPGAIDASFISWLTTESRIETILVEVVARVGGVETTRYLSNTGYTSAPSDTPANQYYMGVVNGGCTTTEQMSLDGQASLAFGDIELINADGSLDAWLNDVWAGRVCRVYVGDQRWTRSNFRLVFDGIVADIKSAKRTSLNLNMRDKLQRLNNAVSDAKLGGTTSDADKLLPLTFGEVSNIEPLLTDKATLTYQVHNGQIEDIIEVRDYGVPVSVTKNLTTGKFSLNASPAGTITASVQGSKPSGVYSNTVSRLVQNLVQNYGTDPFTSTDLDLNQLASFDGANPQPVGVYLSDRTNVLEVCQQLAASVGAQLVMPATGKLRLMTLTLPATSTPKAVDTTMIFDRSMELVDRPEVQPAVKLNYCHNGAVQRDLQTGILPEHKILFADEWMTVTASDSTVATIYKKTKEPEPQDTMLLSTTDATNEANRRLTLWKTQRSVYRFEARTDLITQDLGTYLTVTYPRFNMSGGVTGQVISIERDWINGRVTIEILV